MTTLDEDHVKAHVCHLNFDLQDNLTYNLQVKTCIILIYYTAIKSSRVLVVPE